MIGCSNFKPTSMDWIPSGSPEPALVDLASIDTGGASLLQ
jgi:hypothetical protein